MIEKLRKRLIYKATHRGMKETDKILGTFAKFKLEDLSEDLLHQFDNFLDLPDADILNWLLYKENVPDEYNNQIFHLLIEFKDKI